MLWSKKKIRERSQDEYERVHITYLGEFFRSLPDPELQAVFFTIIENLQNTAEVFQENFGEFLKTHHTIEGHTWNVVRYGDSTDDPASESRYLLHGRIPSSEATPLFRTSLTNTHSGHLPRAKWSE